MADPNRTRRAVLVAGASLALTACIESPVALNVVRSMRTTVLGFPDLDITRETVAKLPYASLAARVGRGPPGLLLLSHIQGEDQYWRTGTEAVLVLRGGRLVRTAGFDQDLARSRELDPDPVSAGLHLLEAPAKHARVLDLEPGGLYELPVESRFESLGERKITIVEIDFDTILVREDCRCRTLAWDFTNYYWVDPVDGFVWQSTQHFARALPALEYKVLKPAA
jgi:hypothetical protein